MKHLKYLSLGSATHQLQQLILGLLIKQTPDRNTAYLPSIFRIHTSSSSKNISGPSRFSMSLKPLQGTYEEDRHTEASVRSSHAVVSHTQVTSKAVHFQGSANTSPTLSGTTRPLGEKRNLWGNSNLF